MAQAGCVQSARGALSSHQAQPLGLRAEFPQVVIIFKEGEVKKNLLFLFL